MSVRQTYLFDEGPAGASPVVSGDIVEVNGGPTYTADSMHGPFALRGSTVGNQFIGINNSGTVNHSGSIYVRPSAQNTGTNRFVNIVIASTTIIFAIRTHSDGHFDITNGGVRADVTTFTWIPDHWYRVDWQYDQTVLAAPTITVRFFIEPEGTIPDETLTSIQSGVTGNAARWRLGLISSSIETATSTIDTFRIADGAEWIGPYGTPPPGVGGKGKVWDANSGTWKTFTPKVYTSGAAQMAVAKVWDSSSGTWRKTNP